MSIRIAPPLLLIFLLMIHSDCTYTYPTGYQIMKVFWTNGWGVKPPDLSKDPEYSQRLQYLGDEQQNCTIRLSHVTQKDEHMYYFRFTTYTPDNKWLGHPGVTLTVTVYDSSTRYNSVRREDAGRYSCALHEHTYISPAVHLNVMYPPKESFVAVNPSGEIVEGDSVTLSCSSDSNPPAEISWFKRGKFVGSGRIYSISKISSDHSGEYKCKSINKRGEKYSDAVTLNVMYHPKSVSVFINGSPEIVEGDSVTLICSSDSNPPAEISWFKEGTFVGSGRIYSISNISSDYSGEYKCKSRNKHGEKDSDAVTLNVMCELMMVQ
uniref:Ig-like domain-containing protein n=1 Tax=Sinocyclocheilus rhinocerous TaxID=307959 RepID=A0A673FJJ3_9TELE